MVDTMFLIADKNKSKSISREELLRAAEENEYFRNIIDKIVKDYRRHQSYGQQEKPFELFEYFKYATRNTKNNVSFPGPVLKLIDAIADIEKIY